MRTLFSDPPLTNSAKEIPKRLFSLRRVLTLQLKGTFLNRSFFNVQYRRGIIHLSIVLQSSQQPSPNRIVLSSRNSCLSNCVFFIFTGKYPSANHCRGISSNRSSSRPLGRSPDGQLGIQPAGQSGRLSSR